MIHIMNWHDPGTVQVHKSFALTVCLEGSLWRNFRIEKSEVTTSTMLQPRNKADKKVEIETKNK